MASVDAARGDSGASPSGYKEHLGATTGNLAIGAHDVFVSAETGIVSVPKTGGVASPVIARSVGAGTSLVLLAVDEAHLYYARGSELLQTSLLGNHPRSFGSSILPAAGLGLSDDSVFWIRWTDVVVQTKDDAGIGVLRDAGGFESPLLLAFSDPYVVVLVYSGGHYRLVRRGKRDLPTAKDVVLAEVGGAVRSLQAVEGKALYWLEKSLGIRAAALDATSEPVAISGDPSLFDFGAMAIDAGHVYWAVRAQGRIYRAARTGGGPTIFAEGFDFPEAPPDVPPRPYEPDPDAHRLAIDESFVYVSDKMGLYRVRK